MFSRVIINRRNDEMCTHPFIRPFFRDFSAILLALSVMACGGGSSDTVSEPPATPPTIQGTLNKSVEDGLDGIVLLVEKNGETETFSAGYHDSLLLVPASENSLFKIASISKLFIATATIQLIDSQVLNANDTIASWLPELNNRIENSESITLKQLLQHRSGVPDFDSQTGFSWQSSHTSIDDTLALALDKPADFSPDERYEYSNTNYLLLGKIMDNALGYPHTTYIQENILTPLEMLNTFHLLSQIDPSLLAKGYWNDFDYTQHEYFIPGGSMVSTLSDVAVFIRALSSGSLLSSQAQALFIEYFGVYAHSGWLPGYQSIARYHADIDAVIIQFVNTTGFRSEDLNISTYNQIKTLVD